MKKLLTCFTSLIITSSLLSQPVIVKDLYPGSRGASPSYFSTHANKLYFSTRDSNNATLGFLYETDGTAGGTTQLQGLGNSREFCSYGNKMLYIDDPTGGNNWEPWITDGTTAGTVLLKDINPGFSGSMTRFLGDVAGTAFLFAQNFGVYKTNGTAAGTSLLFSTGNLYKSIIFNGKVYYWGTHNSVAGLWSFDASSTQPTLMATHTNSVYDFEIATGTNSFYYVATDTAHGYEPWVSDGTAAGTHILLDVKPGFASSCDDGSSSSYTSMAILNGKLYFNPTDVAHGRELWVSDGTAAGTTLFMELVVGASSGNPRNMISTGNKLFFGARIPGYNTDMIWVCDETISGTHVVTDINGSYIEDSGKWPLNNKAFIKGRPRSDQTKGFEPFISDGTSAGTFMLADIDSITQYSESISQGYNQMPFAVGNTMYFVGEDPVYGKELWKYTDLGNTSVPERIRKTDLSLYPNPATSELHISCSTAIEKAELFDLSGALLFSSGQNKLDVSQLSQGVYFLKVYGESAVTVKKFIKQ